MKAASTNQTNPEWEASAYLTSLMQHE